MTTGFDGNFRSKLWTWEKARDYCTQCLPYVDVLLGIEPYHLWKVENFYNFIYFKTPLFSKLLRMAGQYNI